VVDSRPMSQPDHAGRSRHHRFRETALASGLLTAEQLDEAHESVRLVLDRRQAAEVEWDRAVANAVVERGWVTQFQADQMREFGRTVFRLGQYTVLDEIGKGGMGHVFRAEHAMMGRQVAVKVLPRAKSTPESEAAFRREMRMLGRLDHENLVRAFDAGFDAQVYYLVTELVPGVDLKRFVEERGPLDETTAAVVIAQAARGLGYAHEQGLVHRDVKPGNILVLGDMRVKVLDLGLAGSQVAEEASRFDRVIGTMDYIAPEQAQSPDDVGPAADFYSLGCTLYYAVTGRKPFPGGSRKEKLRRHIQEVPQSPRELVPGLSERFCRVIEDLMAKSPADRLSSAAAVVDRLKPWLVEGRRRPKAASAASREAASQIASSSVGSFPGDESSSFWNALIPPAPPTSRWPFGKDPARLRTMAEVRRFGRAARNALWMAVPLGVAFGAAMMFVRKIDEQAFDKLLPQRTPVYAGCMLFLLVFVLQLLVARGGRR